MYKKQEQTNCKARCEHFIKWHQMWQQPNQISLHLQQWNLLGPSNINNKHNSGCGNNNSNKMLNNCKDQRQRQRQRQVKAWAARQLTQVGSQLLGGTDNEGGGAYNFCQHFAQFILLLFGKQVSHKFPAVQQTALNFVRHLKKKVAYLDYQLAPTWQLSSVWLAACQICHALQICMANALITRLYVALRICIRQVNQFKAKKSIKL